MDLSVAVAEFNPLHNGHKLLLERMKSCGDAAAVVMSGDFCQRGEAAVLDKYTRAKHAVLAGADIVFELPTVFSVAPAEIFAKGAIKLLSSLRGKKTLFFGTETGERSDFIDLAEVTSVETKAFKEALKNELSAGHPYALARVNAIKATTENVDFGVLDNPNAILGLEYARAIKYFGSDMDIRPIKRDVRHDGDEIKGNICSALAVRKAVADGQKKNVKKFVPQFVYDDLPPSLPRFDDIVLFKLLETSAKRLKEITDCTEGLENRIKAFAVGAGSLNELIDKLETRRYTRARLQRIITANMLGITSAFTEKCLKGELYLRVLAVAEEKKNLLSELNCTKNKFVVRKSDTDKLSGVALESFELDAFANDVFGLIRGKKTNAYEVRIISR